MFCLLLDSIFNCSIYWCDMPTCLQASFNIREWVCARGRKSMAGNSHFECCEQPKKEHTTPHVTLLLNFQNELWVPYRNSAAKFKIRTRPLYRGPPRYQNRPATVPMSVANSQKKMKSPHIVHSKACCTTKTGMFCGDVDCKISRSEPGRSFGYHNC